MRIRESIERQASINNYNTLAWVLGFGISVVVLAFMDALSWTWLPAIICGPTWIVSQMFLHPKCPFCSHVPHSMAYGIVGKFCENCGESFDRELEGKPGHSKQFSKPNK